MTFGYRDPILQQRRALLQAGVASALGLTLPDLFHARATSGVKLNGQAKACILLYMTGGPAQQETFDPKPDAPSGTRGEFKPISTSVSGVQICEHLPRMAKLIHHCAVFRSVYHGSDTHGVGVHYNLTGLKPLQRRAGEPQLDRKDPPGIGGVMRYLRGDRNGLPAAVQLPRPVGDQNNAMWAGQHAGILGAKYDPLFLFDETWVPGKELPGFQPTRDLSGERQRSRAELLRSLPSQPAKSETEEDFTRFQQTAFDVLNSQKSWRAFRLDDEKPETIERYGDNRFGRSVLIARRLVEAGVALVTVPWMFKQSEQNFDTHNKHFAKMKTMLLPPIDQAFSALIEDLKERGLLSETLIAWTGEFGRTPKINKNAGRDHWGRVYSAVLAGGGIKGGRVIGKSNKEGGLPADNPVHVTDLFATMYQALGVGPETEVIDQTGRPLFPVQGKPIPTVF
ncbi:MAG: DUF1501 domain-containing protein [Gemmataceae bacterium]